MKKNYNCCKMIKEILNYPLPYEILQKIKIDIILFI